MSHILVFTLPSGERLEASIAFAVAAGYTGRDTAHVRQHVEELATIGVPPPPHVPMLYPLIPTLVTHSNEIAVLGEHTTPEVEVAVLTIEGQAYITVASDHTDRQLETVSVTLAKNICPKVVGREVWPVTEVLDHWDKLQLRSVCEGVVLQDGTLSELLPYTELMAFVDRITGIRERRIVFGGTIPTRAHPPRGEVEVLLELHDPVWNRSIRHTYHVRVLHDFFS